MSSFADPAPGAGSAGARGWAALLRVVALRPEEARRALTLGGAYGLVLASLYVLKPVRNSLFLSRIGLDWLPYVMFAVAVFGGATAVLLASAASLRLERLTRWVFAALAAGLLGWWLWLSRVSSGQQVFFFYIWVNLYGQLATALIWLLAGAAVDARESRRVFAFIGALGIAGAVSGGVFTRVVASSIGTLNLLPLCSLLLLAAWLLVERLGSALEGVAARPRRDLRDNIVQDLRRVPLLRVLAAMTLCSAAASAVIDFQFNAAVDAHLSHEDARTAFFGSFFAYLNAGAFLFQLLVTSRFMARVGLGPALLALPSLLSVSGLVAALQPGLVSAAVLKAADAGLRHSLYKSGVEILFVPLPLALRRRFRLFLDATVDNVGTGLGALGVLGVSSWAGVEPAYLGALVLVLVSCWALAVLRARPAHLDAFRDALAARQLHPEELIVDATHAGVVRTLKGSLRSDNERQVAYALDVVSNAPSARFGDDVLELLAHPSGQIRAKALHVLGLWQAANGLPIQPERLLRDADRDVRREAAVFLARTSPQGGVRLLSELVASGDPAIQAAALGAVADLQLADVLQSPRLERVLSLSGPEGEWARRELARALSVARPSAERHYLLQALARDGSPQVVQQTIQSVGRVLDPGLLDWLFERLQARSERAEVIEALASYGVDVVPRLSKLLATRAPLPLRVRATRVLARIPHQRAVSELVAALPESSGELRRAILKALNKLRARSRRLAFDARVLSAELEREARYNAQLRRLLPEPLRESAADRLLSRALSEKRRESLECVFRLLALQYPARDMENAFVAVTSGNPRVRANAVEFLDNVLGPMHKQQVLPLLEPAVSSALRRPVGGGERQRDLAELIAGPDAWLRACALYSAAAHPSLQVVIAGALTDPEPIVRETAKLALARQGAGC